MDKKKLPALFALIIVAVIIVIVFLNKAPAGGPSPANAADAIAESSCLLFDETLSFEDITGMTEGIVQKYGFDNPESIDTYLLGIAGTEEENEVSIALRESLDGFCGEALEERGLDPADMAQAILTE